MANIVINTTDKPGYIVFYMNDVYPTKTDHKEHWFAIDDLRGLDITNMGGEEGLELHAEHEEVPLLLTHTSGLSYFMEVDTVDGVAPTTLNELRDMLLDIMTSGITANTASNATVTTSSTAIVSANDAREGLVLVNTGSNAVFIGIGAAAVLNKGIYLAASGGTWVMDSMTFTKQAINGITASGTSNISIQEFE